MLGRTVFFYAFALLVAFLALILVALLALALLVCALSGCVFFIFTLIVILALSNKRNKITDIK